MKMMNNTEQTATMIDNPEQLDTAGLYDRLRQRRDWLSARIQAKRSVGWCVVYDTSERDALSWALDLLEDHA
jgi:hypothetical protein